MSLFLPWIKAIFIIALVFPLYSEIYSEHDFRYPPDCQLYTEVCTREYHPICASDGKTYSNECTFCNEKMYIHNSKCLVFQGIMIPIFIFNILVNVNIDEATHNLAFIVITFCGAFYRQLESSQ